VDYLEKLLIDYIKNKGKLFLYQVTQYAEVNNRQLKKFIIENIKKDLNNDIVKEIITIALNIAIDTIDLNKLVNNLFYEAKIAFY